MSPIDATPHQSFDALAREKLMRILGDANGARVFVDTLRELHLETLQTADDLYAFGERLTSRGGFEAAVGRLLGVAAIMRGARGEAR